MNDPRKLAGMGDLGSASGNVTSVEQAAKDAVARAFGRGDEIVVEMNREIESLSRQLAEAREALSQIISVANVYASQPANGAQVPFPRNPNVKW